MPKPSSYALMILQSSSAIIIQDKTQGLIDLSVYIQRGRQTVFCFRNIKCDMLINFLYLNLIFAFIFSVAILNKFEQKNSSSSFEI